MAKHAKKNSHSNTIQCNHSQQWKPRDNRFFFPPRTDGSRHNHRCSLLHKRIGYCTSITIITGSDCSSTSQQNLHKSLFPKCSFSIEAPATNLFLLRRKPKHKHHLKRIFRSSHYRLLSLSPKPLVCNSSSAPKHLKKQKPEGKGTFLCHETTAACVPLQSLPQIAPQPSPAPN